MGCFSLGGLAGALPLRHPAKMNMLKPKPMNYTPDLEHLGTCTLCANAAAARAAARAHTLRSASGAPLLTASASHVQLPVVAVPSMENRLPGAIS